MCITKQIELYNDNIEFTCKTNLSKIKTDEMQLVFTVFLFIRLIIYFRIDNN